jgi:hypothetical protein
MTIGKSSITGNIGKMGRNRRNEHGSHFGTVPEAKNLYPIGYHGVGSLLHISLIAGNAFILDEYHDLTRFVGLSENYKVTLGDRAGLTAIGYIKAVEDAETLGGELLANGDMELNPASSWLSVGSPGYLWDTTHVKSGEHSLCIAANALGEGFKNEPAFASTSGKLYKLMVEYSLSVAHDHCHLSIDPGGGKEWIKHLVTPTMTWVLSTIYVCLRNTTASAVLSVVSGKAHRNVFYVDELSLQEVTAPGESGVTIVSTAGGSTQNWESIESAFDPNYVTEITVEAA